jgi:hypothetical protein
LGNKLERLRASLRVICRDIDRLLGLLRQLRCVCVLVEESTHQATLFQSQAPTLRVRPVICVELEGSEVRIAERDSKLAPS